MGLEVLKIKKEKFLMDSENLDLKMDMEKKYQRMELNTKVVMNMEKNKALVNTYDPMEPPLKVRLKQEDFMVKELINEIMERRSIQASENME